MNGSLVRVIQPGHELGSHLEPITREKGRENQKILRRSRTLGACGDAIENHPLIFGVHGLNEVTMRWEGQESSCTWLISSTTLKGQSVTFCKHKRNSIVATDRSPPERMTGSREKKYLIGRWHPSAAKGPCLETIPRSPMRNLRSPPHYCST